MECWKERERQILTSLVNCSVAHQDYESAVKCLDMLREVIEASKREELLASLHSAYGRLYLQLGSLAKAESHFTNFYGTNDAFFLILSLMPYKLTSCQIQLCAKIRLPSKPEVRSLSGE